MSERGVSGQGQGGRKPVVLRSFEDVTGTRCVDIRAVGDGFDWVACRRDPEDGHGWRVIAQAAHRFETDMAA